MVFALAALFLRAPGISPWSGTLIPVLFLFAALEACERTGFSLKEAALDFGGLLDRATPLRASVGPALLGFLREAGVGGLTALLLFPPYVLGFWLFHAPEKPFSLTPSFGLLTFFLTHLAAVAVPEEALFRGYFQTALRRAFPSTWRLFGTELSPVAWIGQAALFALIHLAGSNNPAVLTVFFPGLVFGFLRANRGGIGAAVVFHALSNLLGHVLFEGWLR